MFRIYPLQNTAAGKIIHTQTAFHHELKINREMITVAEEVQGAFRRVKDAMAELLHLLCMDRFPVVKEEESAQEQEK